MKHSGRTAGAPYSAVLHSGWSGAVRFSDRFSGRTSGRSCATARPSSHTLLLPVQLCRLVPRRTGIEIEEDGAGRLANEERNVPLLMETDMTRLSRIRKIAFLVLLCGSFVGGPNQVAMANDNWCEYYDDCVSCWAENPCYATSCNNYPNCVFWGVCLTETGSLSLCTCKPCS
jgi:hypothetical protein